MVVLKEALLNELKYLNSTIDLTDIDSILIGLKYNFRFELGEPYKNGTKKRVNQSTKRASEIFESYFNSDKDIYILIHDFDDDGFAHTPNYLYNLLESNNVKLEKSNKMLGTRTYDENEKLERYKGQLSIALANRNNLKYKEIFKAIANTEMGFEPTIHQILYFLQPSEKKCFYMYDDRGCIIFSQKKSDLNEIIEKFEDWII